MKKYLFPLIALCLCQGAFALKMRPNYPHRYTVQKGDTMWSIADKFLLEPWEWEQLVEANPDLKGSTKLYPGMVLTIKRMDDKPVLALARGATVKLSPEVHSLAIPNPIPPVPLDVIRPFLLPSLVVGKHAIKHIPYIIDFIDERLVGGERYKFYTSTYKEGKTGDKFNLYRPSDTYEDPETHEVLGYAAEYLGDATLLHPGAPASFYLDHSIREIKIGDKVIKSDPNDFPLNFYPSKPKQPIEGRIVSLHGEFLHIGRQQIAVINKGKRDNIKLGNVFAIYEPNRKKEDPIDPRTVYKIPKERIGELMVFRIFEKVSFGLVMRSTESIEKYDYVVNP